MRRTLELNLVNGLVSSFWNSKHIVAQIPARWLSNNNDIEVLFGFTDDDNFYKESYDFADKFSQSFGLSVSERFVKSPDNRKSTTGEPISVAKITQAPRNGRDEMYIIGTKSDIEAFFEVIKNDERATDIMFNALV
ncbi:hypothetical protein [Acidiphilium sp. PM]|uniref:hypothetical protein n=1 Tax=Acidiphilium sp. PM TaxID=1043206 RepID=UPI0002145144|nr:hypothetical protein [Acidiphilium sp. PM]EGO94267.1 Hypothetical protein APM_2916 [Acidiphilium sp. PM]